MLHEVNPQSWTKSNSGGFTMAKYNYEFKAKIVAEYLAGIGSTTLTHRYDIPSRQTIIDWVNKFQTYGVEGLEGT
ncbi:transposase, partial [Furfurilactobacillus entadae]|uniref:transposase n=1 Tax=Furfurilactobacillus entadae TaxID=2922307 RepID=UPI0038B2BD61